MYYFQSYNFLVQVFIFVDEKWSEDDRKRQYMLYSNPQQLNVPASRLTTRPQSRYFTEINAM